MIQAVNNKVLYNLLPPEEQPQKLVLSPNADSLKIGKVLNVGETVTYIKQGDIITVYVNDLIKVEENTYICTDKQILFINNLPQPNKVQIEPIKSESLYKLKKAKVISSNDIEIKPDDTILFIPGQGVILPNHTEIISNTQIFGIY